MTMRTLATLVVVALIIALLLVILAAVRRVIGRLDVTDHKLDYAHRRLDGQARLLGQVAARLPGAPSPGSEPPEPPEPAETPAHGAIPIAWPRRSGGPGVVAISAAAALVAFALLLWHSDPIDPAAPHVAQPPATIGLDPAPTRPGAPAPASPPRPADPVDLVAPAPQSAATPNPRPAAPAAPPVGGIPPAAPASGVDEPAEVDNPAAPPAQAPPPTGAPPVNPPASSAPAPGDGDEDSPDEAPDLLCVDLGALLATCVL